MRLCHVTRRFLPSRRIRFLPVSSPFRDEFEYNNWMYGLVGSITEAIGGASWEQLLETRLLRPLGMADTRVLGQTVTVDADNFAKPYVTFDDQVTRADSRAYRCVDGCLEVPCCMRSVCTVCPTLFMCAVVLSPLCPWLCVSSALYAPRALFCPVCSLCHIP